MKRFIFISVLLVVSLSLSSQESSFNLPSLEDIGGTGQKILDNLVVESEVPPGGFNLEDLLSASMEASVELQTLRTDVSLAESAYQKARAERLPKIDFQTSLSYLGNPMEPLTVQAGEFGVIEIAGEDILLPNEDMVLYSGMESTYYQFKLILEQPIFTWGKIKNVEALYGIAAETSLIQVEKKAEEVRTEVRILYNILYYLNETWDLLEKQKTVGERLITISDESYINGFILYEDLLNTRIHTMEITLGEFELKEKLNQTLLRLSYLTGQDRLTIADLDFSNFSESYIPFTIEEENLLLEEAILHSFDVKLLRSLEEIGALRLAIAESSRTFLPDFGLEIETSFSGSRFPFLEIDWYGQDDWDLTFSVGLSTTLFDGGRSAADINTETNELEKVRQQFKLGVESIDNFILETIYKLGFNLKNMELQILRIENNLEQLGLKQSQYEAGVSGESDLLQKELELYGNILSLYQEKMDFIQNYHPLMSITGRN